MSERQLSPENLISRLHLSEQLANAKIAAPCLVKRRSGACAFSRCGRAHCRTFSRTQDEKLLIVVHRRHLGSARGLPYFIAQRIKARQLVLDSQPHRSSCSQLLALRDHYGVPWRLEIIDGSPIAGSDQL